MRTLRIQGALLLIGALFSSGSAFAAEIRVMASGAFTAAYLALIPQCGESVSDTVVTVTTTMGVGVTSIPSRLERGEAVDVVIVDRDALVDMIGRRLVAAGSRQDLARSVIAMAVRAGATKPTISTVESLTQTLLSARSVAYSASVSGDYLSKELFQQLGVAGQVLPKGRRVVGERVGSVVARGEAEIGFQQISELLPIAGIDYVGPLPPSVQRITVFSAGVASSSTQLGKARAFVECLASREAASIVARSGMEPRYDVPDIRPEFRALAQMGPFLEK